jgi:hypothetical protein
MTSDPFLLRWSKRKHAARSAEQPPESTGSLQPGPRASDAVAEPAAPEPEGGATTPLEAELNAEEVARLPSLEEFTADTDISMFLRKGVPAPLRNAALRRMWSLDPKIRDFVGDARDYAYDWNTPGGVPGSGPLPSTEDVARMAARIVGGGASASPGHEAEAEKAARAPSQNEEQHSTAEADASRTEGDGPHRNPAFLATPELPGGAADAANVLVPPSPADAADNRQPASAAQMPDTDEPGKPASARRHGGAMPL